MRNIIIAATTAGLIALTAADAHATLASSIVAGTGFRANTTVLSPDPSADKIVQVGDTLTWTWTRVMTQPTETAGCVLTYAMTPKKLVKLGSTWSATTAPGLTMVGIGAGTGATSATTTSATSNSPGPLIPGTSTATFKGGTPTETKISATFSEPGRYEVNITGLIASNCNGYEPQGFDPGARMVVDVKSAADWNKPDTGWYWDPTQPGRGFAMQINDAQTAGFIGIFGYDTDGRATFLVSSCRYDPSTRVCLGTLNAFGGGVTIGEVVGPSATATGSVGTISMQWDSINAGSFGGGNRGGVITYGNISRRVTRFAVPDSGETAAAPQDLSKGAGIPTGWYWSSSAAGRGYFIETTRLADGSGRTAVYAVGFMYRNDAARSPTWYVFQGVTAQSIGLMTLDAQTVTEYGGGSPILTSGTNNVWQTATPVGVAGTYTMAMPNNGSGTPVMYLPSLSGQALSPFTISPP